MDSITLGDVDVTRVEETHGPVGLTAAQFLPDMPEQVWDQHREMLVPDHLDPRNDLVQVAMQTWLVRSEGRTILIDTGVGNHKARPLVEVWDQRSSNDYLLDLGRAGVDPAQVDLVVNTHLHVDHVGWNTIWSDGAWVPTFPNAKYLMPRADFEYWDPARNPNVVGGVNENVFEDSIAPVWENGQVVLWDGEHRIDSHLVLQSAPGHTPGSSVVALQSGPDRAMFVGDLVHSPVQVLEPEFNSCFCEAAAAARVTRRRLLGWAADHRALVLPAHFSGHGALEVATAADGFAVKAWGPFGTL